MSRIDDALCVLRWARFFSALDLRSGYGQIPMANDDKDQMAFVIPAERLVFNVTPLSLLNARATFEKITYNLQRGFGRKISLCYRHDVIAYSASFAEHVPRLKLILCLSSAGLQLTRKKSHFSEQKIKVVCHICQRVVFHHIRTKCRLSLISLYLRPSEISAAL